MSNRIARWPTLIALVALLSGGCDGCENHRMAEPMSEEQIASVTEGAPQIFVEQRGTLTLEGLEELYLGQSKDEALEALDTYCERIMTFDGGWRHQEATFKGCNIIADDGSLTTLRAGFWPFADNQLSTLELQDEPRSMELVRARFTEISDRLNQDLPRRGLLLMSSSRYRLIASWDDGSQEPPRITIGFHPP